MNIPKAYIGGFQKAAKSPRMLFILYFSNLLMALILALPFMGFLNNSFGSSKLFENLLEGFDYTAFSNLTFYNADGISVILGSIKWLLLAYFLLSVFLTGGIIRTLNKEKFTTNNFFSGAAYNFFRFLGLSLIMLLVQIVFALLVYIPMGLILDSLGQNLSTELTYYYVIIGGFVLHLLIFLLISIIGDYAKFYLVLNDSFNIFKGFWKGVRYVFKYFLKTYFLYLFLLFIPAVVMYIYLYFEKDLKMATGLGILIVFAMQQAFIFLRVFLRVWILASEFKMYSEDFIQSSVIQDIVFSIVDTKTNDTEKVIEEEKKESEVIKTDEKSEYAIDFNKTFVADNEESKENILSEEEMLKKVEHEEIENTDSNFVEEKNIEKDVVSSPEEEHLDEDDEDEEEIIAEQVQQNVIDTEKKEENQEEITKKEEKKVDDDMIEFEL